MRRRTVRIIAAAFVVMMVSALVPGHSATVRADCHEWPSFVFATRGAQRVTSQSPGNTINLYHYLSALTVWHGGDVMPNTRAHFNYIDVSDGSLDYEFATEESNDEGVIEEDWESLWLGYTAPGKTLAVYGYWMDECGAGQQVAVYLGNVNVNP